MADENKIVYLPQLKHYDTKIKKYIGDADAKVEAKITELSGKAVQSVEMTGVGSAEITGTKLTINVPDTTDTTTALDNRIKAIEGDKTIVKSVEATGATASIADNKLTITVPTPEKYTLPAAENNVLGGVYATVSVEPMADTAIGTVISYKGSGLLLTSIADKKITAAMLEQDVQDNLQRAKDAKTLATTNQTNLTKEIADRKAADETLTTEVGKKANSADVYKKTETYNQTEIDNKVAAALTSAIVPKGSVAFAKLPTPAKANLGFMYNVTDAFTTTASFVEGAGKAYAAGANVYVVDAGEGAYKFDVFMGFVDLSPYQLKADMPTAATDADIDAMFA